MKRTTAAILIALTSAGVSLAARPPQGGHRGSPPAHQVHIRRPVLRGLVRLFCCSPAPRHRQAWHRHDRGRHVGWQRGRHQGWNRDGHQRLNDPRGRGRRP
jgi:hypothetical protein